MLQETTADQRNGIVLTTQDVLNHHRSSFAKGDLSGVMADYDSHSRIFTSGGILRSSAAIREFFTTLLEEFAKPGHSFELLQQEIDGDTAYLVWKAETAENHYEFATDTFIVQNGKILTQTFAGKISPK
jgi:hypothetical protein